MEIFFLTAALLKRMLKNDTIILICPANRPVRFALSRRAPVPRHAKGAPGPAFAREAEEII